MGWHRRVEQIRQVTLITCAQPLLVVFGGQNHHTALFSPNSKGARFVKRECIENSLRSKIWRRAQSYSSPPRANVT